MTFDQLEVGRWYWFTSKYSTGVGQCKASLFQAAGEPPDTYLLRHGDRFFADEVTDIRPVPTLEEWEKLVMIQEKARAVMEWYDRDGSVGGAIDPMDQLRAALAAVGE